MGIPIAELQERISSREFAEYWSHFELEPWGLEREDLRAGIVASTIANVNRDAKKHPRPYTADMFMVQTGDLDRDDEDDDMDPEEAAAHAARIDELMSSLGGEAASEPIVRRRQ